MAHKPKRLGRIYLGLQVSPTAKGICDGKPASTSLGLISSDFLPRKHECIFNLILLYFSSEMEFDLQLQPTPQLGQCCILNPQGLNLLHCRDNPGGLTYCTTTGTPLFFCLFSASEPSCVFLSVCLSPCLLGLRLLSFPCSLTTPQST